MFEPVPGPEPERCEEKESFRAETPDREFSSRVLSVVQSPSYTPSMLLDALSEDPRLSYLLETGPKGRSHTLRDHTHAVLTQYERYFGSLSHPAQFSLAEMRLTLSLHDIGKYIPESTKDQHSYTMGVITGIRDKLPLSEDRYRVMKELIDGDPLGLYLKRLESPPSSGEKGELKAKAIRGALTFDEVRAYAERRVLRSDLEEIAREAEVAAGEIIEAADRCQMPVSDYYDLLLRYFQADSSAHSIDGLFEGGRRSYPSLEYLYVLEPRASLDDREPLLVLNDRGDRLLFSPSASLAVTALDLLLLSRATP